MSTRRAADVESYGAFAYAYDKALGQRFFRAAKKMLLQVMEKHPTPRRTHLDVACGTGLTIGLFRSMGWRSVGVDASTEMLRLARGRGARVAAGDFRALPLRGTFARITCLYDSLNHLKDRNDLVAAFRSIRGVMDADSLFLFDMNHPDIYPVVWGNAEPFVASGADYHLEIATSYRGREKMGHALVTGWALIAGERVKIRETHRQRAWKQREIVDCLAAAGLVPVEVLDFDPYHEAGELDAEGVKLFFVCRAERRLPAGRSAGFQPARRRQDAGGPAGKMPALRGTSRPEPLS